MPVVGMSQPGQFYITVHEGGDKSCCRIKTVNFLTRWLTTDCRTCPQKVQRLPVCFHHQPCVQQERIVIQTDIHPLYTACLFYRVPEDRRIRRHVHWQLPLKKLHFLQGKRLSVCHYTCWILKFVGVLDSRCSDLLRAGRSGDQFPVVARFSLPSQNGPGAHPASYTMGTGSFPGVKRP
jgi:hypothetical protein